MSFLQNASFKMVCLLYCLYEDFTGMFQYFHNFINTWHSVFMAARIGMGDDQFVKKEGINLET